MFTRTFRPEAFLQSVLGTEPLADYCHLRGIVLASIPAGRGKQADLRPWYAALADLPQTAHTAIELDLLMVNELAGPSATAHLVDTAPPGALPPPTIPAGAPIALWYFVHHHDHFTDTFFHHEVQEVETWRTAMTTPGLCFEDLETKAPALADTLQEFFREREGTGQFCSAETHRFGTAVCFVAHVANRLQFFETFTEAGRPVRQRLRRASAVLLVYYPEDGRVLLKSPLRTKSRITELLGRVGKMVFTADVRLAGGSFDLNRLKQPFHPLGDADDMEQVRVKALHLQYPQRDGYRRLKFETLASDAPEAIDGLLARHVDPTELSKLDVCFVELQIGLRHARGRKTYQLRLWPDRCNLSQTELGDRFHRCLKGWGLCHG